MVEFGSPHPPPTFVRPPSLPFSVLPRSSQEAAPPPSGFIYPGDGPAADLCGPSSSAPCSPSNINRLYIIFMAHNTSVGRAQDWALMQVVVQYVRVDSTAGKIHPSE